MVVLNQSIYLTRLSQKTLNDARYLTVEEHQGPTFFRFLISSLAMWPRVKNDSLKKNEEVHDLGREKA